MCKGGRGSSCGNCNAGSIRKPGPAGLQVSAGSGSPTSVPKRAGPVGLHIPATAVGAQIGGLATEEVKRLLVSKLGTCDFYKVLSDLTPGDRERGYYWNYGYKYCKKFNASSLAKDKKAARWIDCVTVNLQREILEKCLAYGSNLERIKSAAYASHARVYTNCGICELDKSLIKQFRVLFVPDAKDLWTELGWQQVKETLRACFFRPYLFDALVNRYTSWGDLKEDRLGKDLAKLAIENAAQNYPVILGVMEMLSNTLDDDDVAEEFVKSLTDRQLDALAETGDGRRVLFLMQSALKSGVVFQSEKKQLARIGNRARR